MGDKLFWEFYTEYGDEDVFSVFKDSLNLGIIFIDTAEIYGAGVSESLIGRFIAETKQPVFIATKFMPYPWRLSKSSLMIALSKSLKRLGLPRVDISQIHTLNPLYRRLSGSRRWQNYK
ncbi:MAG: aldo/keto reductase [Anaerolineaceae bacterium]